jgi:hypothetical protein
VLSGFSDWRSQCFRHAPSTPILIYWVNGRTQAESSPWPDLPLPAARVRRPASRLRPLAQALDVVAAGALEPVQAAAELPVFQQPAAAVRVG